MGVISVGSFERRGVNEKWSDFAVLTLAGSASD